MGLEQLVAVNISRNTLAVSAPGFGTPFILSDAARGIYGGNEVIRTYLTDATGVLTDFTSGSDEYKAASRLFAQKPKPTKIKIGKMKAKVAQIETITPTAVNTHDYGLTLNGTTYTYTSDNTATIAEIVAGLIALVNADAGAPATATGTTTLILTAKTAGIGFSIAVGDPTNMALVHTTANTGVAESMAAVRAVDDDFYGVITTLRGNADLLALAAYIEGTPKILGVSTSDANALLAASTTDIAYLIKNGNYFRTWCLYSSDYANYPEAGFFGRCLPTIPGSETWANKTLAVTPTDALNGTQIAALKAKNCNYYITLGGKAMTLDGKVGGGDFIDIIRLIDAITSDMMVGVFGAITGPDKLPYTNGGITSVQAQVDGVLRRYQKTQGIQPDQMDSAGNLVPGYTTFFPRVFDIPQVDRQNRILTGGTFSAQLAGAIHAATINGNVTV